MADDFNKIEINTQRLKSAKKYFDKGDPYHCYCHKTTRLMKEKFSKIDMLDKLIIIDECHHFNKKEQLKKLPEFFNYRMGLSATPFNRYDKEKNELYLLEYFEN